MVYCNTVTDSQRVDEVLQKKLTQSKIYTYMYAAYKLTHSGMHGLTYLNLRQSTTSINTQFRRSVHRLKAETREGEGGGESDYVNNRWEYQHVLWN